MTSPPDDITEEEREIALIEGEHLMESGQVDRQQNRFEDAENAFNKALTLFKQLGDPLGQGKALGNLGTVYQYQGQLEQAVSCYRQSLAIAENFGNQRSAAICRGNIAGILHAKGQVGEAINEFERAISLVQQIGDKIHEGHFIGNLGTCYQCKGELDEALRFFSKARSVAQDIGDRRSEGIQLGNLGDIYLKQGRLENAAEALQKAIQISQDVMPVAAGAFRGSLGLVVALSGDLEGAHAILDAGEVLVKPMQVEYAKFLCKKGRVCHIGGDAKRADSALQQAKRIAEEMKLPDESELSQAIAELAELLE